MIIANDDTFVKLSEGNWGIKEQADSSVKVDSVM